MKVLLLAAFQPDRNSHLSDVILSKGGEVGDPGEALDDLLLGGHLLGQLLRHDVLVHVRLLLHLLQQALRGGSGALSKEMAYVSQPHRAIYGGGLPTVNSHSTFTRFPSLRVLNCAQSENLLLHARKQIKGQKPRKR